MFLESNLLENIMNPSLINGFIRRQLRDIRAGGAMALRSKVVKVFVLFRYVIYVFLVCSIFSPLLLVIRLMRPWLLVRLGKLETSGIGHLSLPVEMFLCELECGLHNPGQRFFDIWYAEKIVCNRTLLNKWGYFLAIGPRWILKPVDLLNQLIPGGNPHKIPYRYLDNLIPWQGCDIHNVLKTTRPHITFSKEEESRAIVALESMGIKENDSTICFMARDKAFYSEIHGRWDHRNSSVDTIADVMNDLTPLGYKAVRMGAKVTTPLRSVNSSIIDYPNNGMRSELLDLFLISRCRFMVSTCVGLDALAPTFRRPLVYVNFAEFGNADLFGIRSDLIFIPKKFWSLIENRFLTFSEIFKLGAHLFTLTWQYKKAGIEWVDNDVEEIRAVVFEMEQRISGNWISNPEDEALQSQFRSLWPIRTAGLNMLQARIGAEFLRRNQELLR